MISLQLRALGTECPPFSLGTVVTSQLPPSVGTPGPGPYAFRWGPGWEPDAWPLGGEAVTSGLLLWVSPDMSSWVFLFLQRGQTRDLSGLF